MSQYFYVCCTWGRGDKDLEAEGEAGRIVETQLPEVPLWFSSVVKPGERRESETRTARPW